MNVKKIFFPIGGGEELRERIHGALLVNKYFGSHMSILAFQLDPETVYNVRMTLRGGILMDEFIETAKEELKIEQQKNINIAKEEAEKVGIKFTENQHEPSSTFLRNDVGTRSQLVEKYSKYCDLVVAAVPPNGAITGTFEAAVLKSGKPVIVIPRKLKTFKADRVLLSLTGSTSSSRALTNAISILKEAKEVHCITAHHYLEDDIDETRGRIRNYLSMHGIDPTFEVVKTEGKIPGQALIDSAKEHQSDLIVTGMAENSGFREIFLGGTSKYFLQNTTVPVLM